MIGTIRAIKFIDIKDNKKRREYEHDIIKMLLNDETKKGKQGYLGLVNVEDDLIIDATMWCYDNDYSIDPNKGEVFFQIIRGENEDGEIIPLAIQPSTQYPATLKDAMKTGKYIKIETTIDGNDLLKSNVVCKAYRVDGKTDVVSKTFQECIEHGIEWSPTLSKIKTFKDFSDKFIKFINGDKSESSPWFIGPEAMAKKWVLKQTIKTDKASAYSEEYLNTMRINSLDALDMTNVKVDINTGEVKTERSQNIVVNTLPLMIGLCNEDEDLEI